MQAKEPPARRRDAGPAGFEDSFEFEKAVPTLFRFFAVLLILAGLGFAAVYALATFVRPVPREITVTLPASKLQPQGR